MRKRTKKNSSQCVVRSFGSMLLVFLFSSGTHSPNISIAVSSQNESDIWILWRQHTLSVCVSFDFFVVVVGCFLFVHSSFGWLMFRHIPDAERQNCGGELKTKIKLRMAKWNTEYKTVDIEKSVTAPVHIHMYVIR